MVDKSLHFPHNQIALRVIKIWSIDSHVCQWPSPAAGAFLYWESLIASGPIFSLQFFHNISPFLLFHFGAVQPSSMGIYFSKEPSWWDREFDTTGKSIRADVRTAAIEVWKDAYQRANAVLGDACEAAALMERAVMQISRYLDHRRTTQSAQNTNRLLMCAFCRSLRRHTLRLRRVELAGNLSEISAPHNPRSCTQKEDCRLDAEKIVRRLSERARSMYELRNNGFEWREIAEMLNTSDGAARAEYSRELKRARTLVTGKCRPGAKMDQYFRQG